MTNINYFCVRRSARDNKCQKQILNYNFVNSNQIIEKLKFINLYIIVLANYLIIYKRRPTNILSLILRYLVSMKSNLYM